MLMVVQSLLSDRAAGVTVGLCAAAITTTTTIITTTTRVRGGCG